MRMVGMAGTTALGLAAAWWVYSRLTARAALEQLIEDSVEVFAARVYVKSLPPAQVPPKLAWLTQGDGARVKAQQLVGLTNTTTAEDGYRAVLVQLPQIPAAQPQNVLPGLLAHGIDAVSEALGVKVPRGVRSEVQGLASTPQGQNVDGLVTSVHGLWEWQLGQQEQRR